MKAKERKTADKGKLDKLIWEFGLVHWKIKIKNKKNAVWSVEKKEKMNKKIREKKSIKSKNLPPNS